MMTPSELLPFSALLEQFPNAQIERCETQAPDPATSLTSTAVRKEHMTAIGSGSSRARKLPTGGNTRGGAA